MIDPSGTLSPYNDDTIEIKHDPLGIIGAQFDLDRYKIQWKMAKQFTNDKFVNVAKYLKKVKRDINPNFMGMETNNQGGEILKLFHRKYDMKYIHGVNMSGELTEVTRAKGYSMDKPFMIDWFKKRKQEGMFEFPEVPTKDMQEFIDQIPKIVQSHTANGSTTYKAYRNQHDDLFMAALHCSNIIRLFIEEQERLK